MDVIRKLNPQLSEKLYSLLNTDLLVGFLENTKADLGQNPEPIPKIDASVFLKKSEKWIQDIGVLASQTSSSIGAKDAGLVERTRSGAAKFEELFIELGALSALITTAIKKGILPKDGNLLDYRGVALEALLNESGKVAACLTGFSSLNSLTVSEYQELRNKVNYFSSIVTLLTRFEDGAMDHLYKYLRA